MSPGLVAALKTADELELVTTGRRSGRPHAVTLWFAHDDGVLWLRGDRNSDWYRNLAHDPACRVRVAELEASGRREPIADEARGLRELIVRWRAKYGAEWVGDWYVERGRVPVLVRVEDAA